MSDVKSKIMQVMTDAAALQDATLGSGYPFRMATWNIRCAMEAGTVTVTQARQLGALTPEEQRAKVAEIELATAGTKGHEKARRQRQILGDAKPRLKTRKEITKALEGASGEYAAALRWVLGEAV